MVVQQVFYKMVRNIIFILHIIHCWSQL